MYTLDGCLLLTTIYRKRRRFMIVGFCGHSTYVGNAEDEKQILDTLESRIGELPCEFFLGGYGSFDHFAYECARKFKGRHPDAKLFFVTPYLLKAYSQCQAGEYDGVIYPPLENTPPRYAITRRNRWIVEQADLLIAYVTHEFGGAYAMYRYAKCKNKEIYRLRAQEFEDKTKEGS